MDSLSFNAMPAFESVGSFQVDQASIQEKKERLKAKNRKYYIENKERLNADQKRHQAENKCPHDKCKSRCLECGGNEICQHKKMKQRCVDCRGSQVYIPLTLVCTTRIFATLVGTPRAACEFKKSLLFYGHDTPVARACLSDACLFVS